ncbi:DUF2294 domain-containing protein [Conexibacter sp. JD483]|uniref:DUF2294 domain-containing protein n=1 Tax=unclassified Conexibacter TaxID=2627773 RepID=UPI0027162D58|nr:MULTISPECIES: DUF2294 domain-containing protein [unclassified Conexibacter]MDO8188521.1 DUF2294 domain-containing protein [Conexibacter sp. CPCC 205706]MDO8200135.1 DUF2294 domain-containing protein [Conexibacter sp. CPCC 205762]MDR9371174.1 DUF2294 domain-containing protein [Conexibacter sp. JD483]
MAEADEPIETEAPGAELLSRISNEMVRMMKEYFGRGPTRAKSYMLDDLLVVVMRDGMTTAERTMLEFGRSDVVRQFRQEFENAMADKLIGAIEQLTGRTVVTYQSQVMFEPNTLVELFLFDEPVADAGVHAIGDSDRDG